MNRFLNGKDSSETTTSNAPIFITSVTGLTTALANKMSSDGASMTGDLSMGANNITSSAVPTNDSDLTNKLYVDGAVASVDISDLVSKSNVSLQTLSGSINMNNNNITMGTGSIDILTSHKNDISNPHGVTKTQIGLSDVLNIKHNISGTADPLVTDNDTGGGYSVGSLWINNSSNKAFICVDITVGSATWSVLGDNTAVIDSHISDTTVHFTEASIDHNNISNSGTNPHAVIDSHLASISNPHSVTKDQIGLADVQNIKCNFDGTVDPNAGNGLNEGYGKGSIWVNTTTQTAFLCVDTDGNSNDLHNDALWVEIVDKTYVDNRDDTIIGNISSGLSGKMNRAGDTMAGDLAMGSNKITSTYTPIADEDLSNKLYVDDQVATISGTAMGLSSTAIGYLDLHDTRLAGDIVWGSNDFACRVKAEVSTLTDQWCVLRIEAPSSSITSHRGISLYDSTNNEETFYVTGSGKVTAEQLYSATSVVAQDAIIGERIVLWSQPRLKFVKNNYQDFADGTITTVTFRSTADFAIGFDTFDPSAGTFTIPDPGVYSVGYEFGFNVQTSSTSNGYIKFYVDGLTGRRLANTIVNRPLTTYHSYCASTIQEFAGGEVLTFKVRNEIGSNVYAPNYNSTNKQYQGDFWCYRLS